MKVEAYIHSLKDQANNRHVLGEAEIIECIGDNQYLAEYNDVRCTAIFNIFDGRYFVDDVYGILNDTNIADKRYYYSCQTTAKKKAVVQQTHFHAPMIRRL